MGDPNPKDFLSITEAAEKIGVSELVGLNVYKNSFIARPQFLPLSPEPATEQCLQVSEYQRKMNNPISFRRCFDA